MYLLFSTSEIASLVTHTCKSSNELTPVLSNYFPTWTDCACSTRLSRKISIDKIVQFAGPSRNFQYHIQLFSKLDNTKSYFKHKNENFHIMKQIPIQYNNKVDSIAHGFADNAHNNVAKESGKANQRRRTKLKSP